LVKDKIDKELEKVPALDSANKVIPKVVDAVKGVQEGESTEDKIKAVADAVPKIVDSIHSEA
jgi:hypothetical protein